MCSSYLPLLIRAHSAANDSLTHGSKLQKRLHACHLMLNSIVTVAVAVAGAAVGIALCPAQRLTLLLVWMLLSARYWTAVRQHVRVCTLATALAKRALPALTASTDRRTASSARCISSAGTICTICIAYGSICAVWA